MPPRRSSHADGTIVSSCPDDRLSPGRRCHHRRPALAAAALAAATLIAAAFLIAAAGSSKGGSGESVCSVQHTHKHTAPDALR